MPARSAKQFLSRIWIRLLAFNVLLVFLPAAGVSYLAVYERQLLRAQEQSMVQQGRLLAAALSERGPNVDQFVAEPILARLEQRTPARIRVLDREGWLVSDTNRLGPIREPSDSSEDPSPGKDPRAGWLYRVGSSLFNFLRQFAPPLSAPRALVGENFYSADTPFDGVEIRQALRGQYGAATRITPGGQRSVTLYSALPVGNEGEVVGVVLVSQSTFHILQDLYEVRLAVFGYVVGAAGVAAILSLMVSTTISRPLEKLRSEAVALLDRRGRLTGSFRGSARLDEIGDLSRALAELSRRLEERMRFTESFAADVSHEFKNPLTSIRAAAEMLKEVDEPALRARFGEIVEKDIARLERLLTAVRDITLVDSGVEAVPPERVDVGKIARALASVERYRRVELAAPESPLIVQIPGDRIAQILENLLDNALSFTPEDGGVGIRIESEGDAVRMLVEDGGPGVPEEHRERVFDRFFSYRPDRRDRDHSGLGLAIVRAIVERYGGTLSLVESSLGGAGFAVRLPLAPD